ncbi:MAG TPA: sigma factor-like helix-turn-helix DNA-binding protein [Streptosporangiaceae bacterium]|nr:sigma factor-like helix-turn-helix DNA-binding protein [Streptosporangiaceae bacterium]
MRTPRPRASRKPAGPATGRPAEVADPGADDVGGTVAALYAEHYRPLVRLAVLLVSDLASAEEIVQEAFADLHGTWRMLPGPDAGLRYLRRSLIRRSRAATSQQADPGAGLLLALRALPARQREVLVLRYFADLPEAEIAAVTGTRIAVVRTYAARGMSSLRAGLPGNVA